MEKKEKLKILFQGLRNVLLLPTVFCIGSAHNVGYGYDERGPMFYERHDWWDTGLIFKGLGWALLIVVAFLIVERIEQRRRER